MHCSPCVRRASLFLLVALSTSACAKRANVKPDNAPLERISPEEMDEARAELKSTRLKAILDHKVGCQGRDAAACERVCYALGPQAACQTACDAGRAGACFELGQDLALGLARPGIGERTGPGTRDVGRAAELLARACRLGYSPACAEAAPLLFEAAEHLRPREAALALELARAGCTLNTEANGITDSRYRACARLAVLGARAGDLDAYLAGAARSAGFLPALTSPLGGGYLAAWVPGDAELGTHAGSARKNDSLVARGRVHGLFSHCDQLGLRKDLRASLALMQNDFHYLLAVGPRLLPAKREVFEHLALAYDDLERATRLGEPSPNGWQVERYVDVAHKVYSELVTRFGTNHAKIYDRSFKLQLRAPREGQPSAQSEKLVTGNASSVRQVDQALFLAGMGGLFVRENPASAFTRLVEGGLWDFFPAGPRSGVMHTMDGRLVGWSAEGGVSKGELTGAGYVDQVWVDGATLFSVNHAGVIHRSTDRGATFTPVFTQKDVRFRAVGGRGLTVYAQGNGPLVRSKDGGKTWEQVGPKPATDVRRLFVTESGKVLRCSNGGAVERSADAGATWTRVLVPHAIDLCAFAELGKGRLALTTTLKEKTRYTPWLNVSGDEGLTWATFPLPLAEPSAAAAPGGDGRFGMVRGLIAVGEGELLAVGEGGATGHVPLLTRIALPGVTPSQQPAPSSGATAGSLPAAAPSKSAAALPMPAFPTAAPPCADGKPVTASADPFPGKFCDAWARCERGEVGYCGFVANELREGKKVTRDLKTGSELEWRACQLNSVSACRGLFIYARSMLGEGAAWGRPLLKDAAAFVADQCKAGRVEMCVAAAETLQSGGLPADETAVLFAAIEPAPLAASGNGRFLGAAAGARNARQTLERLRADCETRGTAQACLALGARLREGKSAPLDPAGARAAYGKVCAAGDCGACAAELGLVRELGDEAAAVQVLGAAAASCEKACVAGAAPKTEGESTCEHAAALAREASAKDGEFKALELLGRDCARGVACMSLAMQYTRAEVADAALKPTAALLATACTSASGPDRMDLCEAPRRREQFQRALKKCTQNDAEACEFVASELDFTNPKRAMELLQKSCDSGRPSACGRLSSSFDARADQGKDYAARAAEVLAKMRARCDAGSGAWCMALVDIAANYRKVGPKESDRPALYGLAIAAFTKECGKGIGASCREAALLHRQGKGTEKSVSKALELFKKACAAKDAGSCNNVAAIERACKAGTEQGCP
jgi:TPR repeat protein